MSAFGVSYEILVTSTSGNVATHQAFTMTQVETKVRELLKNKRTKEINVLRHEQFRIRHYLPEERPGW